MNDPPRVPIPASAVGLLSGVLPSLRDVSAVVRASWPEVRVGELRPRRDSTAERSLAFLARTERVGAAHFPWRVAVGDLAFPDHTGHVWLSVHGYDVARRQDALRLLARAAAAIALASDAAFVWWSVGDRVLAPATFVASAREQA